MIIDKNLLKKYTNFPYYNLLIKQYPGGCDFVKFLQGVDKDTCIKAAQWGLTYLPLSDADKVAIYDLLDIENCENHFGSYNIHNSKNTIYSSEIYNCINLYSCTTMVGCNNAVNCDSCEESGNIFNSSFCTNSVNILNSKNCEDSTNIVNSVMMLRCRTMYNCNNAVDCGELVNCDRARNSYFSSWCNKLNYSFFCSRTQGDFLLFNEPYDKEMLDMIFHQYQKLVAPLKFVDNWPIDFTTIPTSTANFKKYYINQTERFWEWVKTLPNYNPKILYEITMMPQFII